MIMIMIANTLTLTLNVGNVIIPFLQMKNWIPEYLNNLPSSHLFTAVLGLHCYTWAFSSCGDQRLL